MTEYLRYGDPMVAAQLNGFCDTVSRNVGAQKAGLVRVREGLGQYHDGFALETMATSEHPMLDDQDTGLMISGLSMLIEARRLGTEALLWPGANLLELTTRRIGFTTHGDDDIFVLSDEVNVHSIGVSQQGDKHPDGLVYGSVTVRAAFMDVVTLKGVRSVALLREPPAVTPDQPLASADSLAARLDKFLHLAVDHRLKMRRLLLGEPPLSNPRGA